MPKVAHITPSASQPSSSIHSRHSTRIDRSPFRNRGGVSSSSGSGSSQRSPSSGSHTLFAGGTQGVAIKPQHEESVAGSDEDLTDDDARPSLASSPTEQGVAGGVEGERSGGTAPASSAHGPAAEPEQEPLDENGYISELDIITEFKIDEKEVHNAKADGTLTAWCPPYLNTTYFDQDPIHVTTRYRLTDILRWVKSRQDFRVPDGYRDWDQVAKVHKNKYGVKQLRRAAPCGCGRPGEKCRNPSHDTSN